MPSADSTTFTTVDALIVGGGPVGLLTGLQLTRMGCNALIVGKHRLHRGPARLLNPFRFPC